MSEMRQRRSTCPNCGAVGQTGKFCAECGFKMPEREGGGSATAAEKNQSLMSESPAQTKAVEEFMAMMQKETDGPKPGLSHEAKKWKDALATDPYNMQFITQLGVAYAQDRHWTKSVTVLMRGWKRVQEFNEPDASLQYLQLLAQGSYKLQKYRQALAVLHDVSEEMIAATDEETKCRIYGLRCQVHCANGDQQKGLKAFHQAVEGQSFDSAAAAWSACLLDLEKVDLLEVTRSTLQSKAANDEERQKLEAMESIVKAKEQCRQELMKPKYPPALKHILYGIYGLCVLFVIYVLYIWEQRSFAKIGKK